MADVPTMDNDHSNQKHESIASSQSLRQLGTVGSYPSRFTTKECTISLPYLEHSCKNMPLSYDIIVLGHESGNESV